LLKSSTESEPVKPMAFRFWKNFVSGATPSPG
jgi:hypothetical protein